MRTLSFCPLLLPAEIPAREVSFKILFSAAERAVEEQLAAACSSELCLCVPLTGHACGASEPPAVVVLVLEPGAPMAETCRSLREAYPLAHIIAALSCSEPSVVRDLVNAGADDVSGGDVSEITLRLQLWAERSKVFSQREENSSTALARFESVWQNSLDGIRLSDTDGVILAVNPAFCSIVEMSESELVGQKLNVVFSDLEDRDQMLERYRRRFQEGQREVRFGRDIHLRCGKTRYLEFSLSLFSTPTGDQCLTLVRDRTERRLVEVALSESEQHFRSLWERSFDGMRLTDEEGIILDVNDAFCRLMRVSRDEVVGRSMTVLHRPEEDHDLILRNYRVRFGTPERSARFDGKVPLLTGDELEVEVSCVVFGEEPGKRRMVCVFHDLTDRRAAERQRLELERKLFEAQRLESLGGLAGGIAHDFNNLLTAIIGNTSLAAAILPVNSQAQPLLANAEKTSLQAAELCKQMLAYAGRGKISVRKLLLKDLLNEMDHLLRVSISRNVSLLVDIPPGLPPVEAEPSQLQQVLVNLVINASEAIGPDQPGVVRVSASLVLLDQEWLAGILASPEARAGWHLVLEVCDSGPGMAPETAARIFDPFFTTKFTGRGLGLASVLGIVRRHHGAISVESELGRGTTFRVALPASEGDVPVEVVRDASPSSRPGCGLALVVDDEAHIRKVTEVMLQHAGYSVISAVNGEEGLHLFQARREEIQVVLLDLTMPVMDGATALARIREVRPDVPVLLMSGYSDSDLATSHAELPLLEFLPKPFSYERLVAKLANLLEQKPLATDLV